MIQVISGFLVILWVLGWTYHVGGEYIHLLLVLAGILFLAHLATLEKPKAKLVARAPRVEMKTPIHFRKHGDANWRIGITENVSRTGVLFQTGSVMVPGTRIEMTFEIDEPILGAGAVTGEGSIVRMRPAPFGDGTLLAAKILTYELKTAASARLSN